MDPGHNLLERRLPTCLLTKYFKTLNVCILPKHEGGKCYYLDFHSWETKLYNTARKERTRRKSIFQKAMNQLHPSCIKVRSSTPGKHCVPAERQRPTVAYGYRDTAARRTAHIPAWMCSTQYRDTSHVELGQRTPHHAQLCSTERLITAQSHLTHLQKLRQMYKT